MAASAPITQPMADLRRRVLAELERCAVGRDNPAHRRLAAGQLTVAERKLWAKEQWHWHRAFPAVLAILAAQCPSPELRSTLLRRAALEDGAMPAESPGRCAEWERVSEAFGVGRDQLVASQPGPETETMITVQRAVAARPFHEGWVGIMVGVDGETQMHNVARREAMRGHYGVPDEALRYVPVPAANPMIEALDPVEPYLDGSSDGACEALRLVLHARWNYFNAIGRGDRTC